MNPCAPFIQRPVATSLLAFAILLVGLTGFRYLPLSALPEVDYPTIQVQAFYPGASPEVMATSVTAVLERNFGQMPGLKEMTSVSSGGQSIVTLQFDLTLSLDIAEQQVQAAINQGGTLLPALPQPPIYRKVNPADAPVITLALHSSSMPLTEVQNIADTRIAQKISQLPGVGVVSMPGAPRPAVRVQANLQQLSSYGLNIDDLRTTISNNNSNAAKGTFDGANQSYTINANDQLRTADEYRRIIVTYKNGAPVYLSDVASINEGAENNKLGSWAGLPGDNARTIPAVLINVQRQPLANVIAVVDGIKDLVPQMRANLPGSMSLDILTDRTEPIRASVHDTQIELVLAVVLVVLVIFVFLRNVPATIIPGLSVPLSIIGTFAVMYQLGFSLNNLSLMALTISAGFVVDDAIVMIENISRYIEQGETPFNAAMKGSGEIGFTIVSLTVSLIAVLIPLLFMEEVVGRLFREFALTLTICILISAVVSLTVVPMLCAKLMRSHDPAHPQLHGKFFTMTEEWYEKVVSGYDRVLIWVLGHQRFTLMVALGTLVLTVMMYTFIPKGFFPLQDTGFVQAITEASPSISYPAMATRQDELAREVLKDPAVASLSSFIGVDGTNNTLNSGRFMINLKPKAERDGVVTVVARLKALANQVPGITFYPQPVQDISTDTAVGRAQYTFVLQSASTAELNAYVPKLMAALARAPEVTNTTTPFLAKGLSAYIVVDRDTAARFGITSTTISNALNSSFGQRIVTTMYTESNQYRVILEADPKLQGTVRSLQDIFVSAGGSQVRLSTVAKLEQRQVPLQINHLGQFPSANVSFDVAPGYSLGSAVQAVVRAQQEAGLPPTITAQFQGSANSFQSALTSQILLIIAAIITVYIVLGVLYESFIHPVTILSTLPSAGVGALLALIVTGNDLSIVSIIGIILLIGIVMKNAIMMIDFALEAERNEGLDATSAIHQAARLRFRPILMTTVAALFGALPLVFGNGMGAELRHPLGISIVGGLIMSQMLTLFTTPVIYIYFSQLGDRLSAWNARRQASPTTRATQAK
jgi:multidrug efflux pump